MSFMTKPIPTALQRRAAELPCDGVKRYKVRKQRDLSYSEARAAILSDSDLGPNDKGGRTLKRGTAQRLSELNRFYFRAASEFITKTINDMKAQQDVAVAPQTVAEIDDGGSVGSEIVPPVASVAPIADTPYVATDLDMKLGDSHEIVSTADGTKLGVLSFNKSGYRAALKEGTVVRSRSMEVVRNKITEALHTSDWSV